MSENNTKFVFRFEQFLTSAGGSKQFYDLWVELGIFIILIQRFNCKTQQNFYEIYNKFFISQKTLV